MAQDLSSTYEWVTRLAQAFDIDVEAARAVVPALLDLTRDIAHQQARPAAPLSAFLVGLAAKDASVEEIEALIEKARELL
ncbi:DUF6457 domain-containing protein [Corynebacterium pelargi]|uniref:Uncharacterized protein n=1 Tax=Corynebacterium pelargi TaxID=1471400 RepID=A0A410WAX2_9CORY|nr:DUF6457 domain-containing protein [Corynebacterium pelargi]QAU53076.1 hypothetical protein CPELA_09105 [Corynebacterium pelargi]GGG75028.1 hypothetical protein GCM10007338_10630 [Corynebacterium pelargi]